MRSAVDKTPRFEPELLSSEAGQTRQNL